MNRKLFTLLLLLAIVTGTVNAQRGKRAIKRIDREVQEAVFIPKGTWMAGGAVSYSEHDESNLNFLVIKDLEGKGYNFAISPYVGYFSGIISRLVSVSPIIGIIWIWETWMLIWVILPFV